jgi:hypothetical protein
MDGWMIVVVVSSAQSYDARVSCAPHRSSIQVRPDGGGYPFPSCLLACLPPCSPCTRLDTMRRQLSPVVSPSDYSSPPSAYPQFHFLLIYHQFYFLFLFLRN